MDFFVAMENHFILETTGLNHSFKEGGMVLNNVNLQVPEGAVYGFLGANGAGKTTTLRLILGLLKKQQGTIHVFGKQFDQHRIEILKETGGMIESPSLYGHLTARENLQVLQKIYQCPSSAIEDVLKKVGLSNTGNKKAARFSLGMKQRLSIAMALLHNPRLLILDEPTNGLDPNGMIEMRELLISLNQQHGITILISSHLLGEIEKMVSHVGIIHGGTLIFQGTLPALQQHRSSSAKTILVTNEQQQTVQLLNTLGITYTFNKAFQLPLLPPAEVANLVAAIVKAGIGIYSIHTEENDLESIFMEMITN